MTTTTNMTPTVRELFFKYDPTLPLETEEREEGSGGARQVHFRITSIRDERVPGHLWLPEGPGPHPVIMLQHGAGSRKEDAYISSPAARWAREGYATVAIDAHNHGERRTGPADDRSVFLLPWRRLDHAVQMAVDSMRVVDYLHTRSEIAPHRIGYVGFSMGAIFGVPFVGLDRRVAAAVFCLGGSLAGRFADIADSRQRAAQATVSAITDPVHFAPLISPRPTLMINGRRDDVVPPESAQQLYDALGEPKEIVWYDGGHTDLTGELFKRMWSFLRANV